MSSVDLDIIIVSYNTRDITLGCLRSLRDATEGLSTRVILIDNASGDDTVKAVREQYPDVLVIANRDNRGFAAANNQGLAHAHGRYQLLLNSDTEVHPDALRTVVQYADQRPDVGIVGCRSYSADGRQQLTMFRAPRLRDLALNIVVPRSLMVRTPWLGQARYVGRSLDEEHDVEVVTGCFMLTRREVIQQIGGLDEHFFMYGEEVEWCHRVRQAGWKVRYMPAASILHYGGVSAERCESQMTQAMARSQVLLFQKLRGRGAAYTANLLMLLRDLPRGAAWSVLRLYPWPASSSFANGMRRSMERLRLHARGMLQTDWIDEEHERSGRPLLPITG